MPTHTEASRLNLEYYRKQAKALLKAAKSGYPEALQRLSRRSVDGEKVPTLHDAQLTIAREQGFRSWPHFRAFWVHSNLDFSVLVNSFVESALSDLKKAQEMLAKHADIANAGLYAALVLGDFERAEEAFKENPKRVGIKGGPREWEPLLYVCFSRFASGKSSRADRLVKLAEMLLRYGANPNAFYIHEQWPDSPLPCLYGATGLNNNPALAEALLKSGAKPNDGESLYHSAEHPDLECVRLLLKYGASANSTNVLKHMLDREDAEGVRLLLAAGADANAINDKGETALHWAVWRGRSPKVVEILLDSGAHIDVKRNDGRTAYALAVQSGQTETATLLTKQGANTEISTTDRFMGACQTARPEVLERLLTEAPDMTRSPEVERLLPDLTTAHRTAAVRSLLAAGVPVDGRGDLGGTALHWACWKGYADLAKLLLDHGASLTVEDHQFHGTPSGWFGHGVQNCPESGGDYALVARLLLAAGATIPERDMPTGHADVDAVLREYGLIK